MEQLTVLQGVQLDNYHVVPFNKQALKNIDLKIYTPERVHFLVNALVNNTKLPTQQAMIRSEKRNLKKSGADKADQVVGRPQRVQFQVKKSFNVPNRYGRKVGVRRSRRITGNRQRGRVPNGLFNRVPMVPMLPPPMGIFPHPPNQINIGTGVVPQFPIPPQFLPSFPIGGVNIPNQPLPGQLRMPPLLGMSTINPQGIPPQIGQLPVGFPVLQQLVSGNNMRQMPLPPGIPPMGQIPNGNPQMLQFSILPPGYPYQYGINPNIQQSLANGHQQNAKTQIEQNSNSPVQIENVPQPLPQGFCFTQLVDSKKLEVPTLCAEEVLKQKKQQERKKNLPAEIVRKRHKRNKIAVGKQRISAFKTHSTEWNIIKGYRSQASQIIEELRKSEEYKVPRESKNPIPVYFQKKKANQKRRRQQKHELIKKNRKELAEIFGNAIFQKGWPISRKQIKKALGIQEEQSNVLEHLGEFMEMAEDRQVEKITHEIQSLEIDRREEPREGQQW